MHIIFSEVLLILLIVLLVQKPKWLPNYLLRLGGYLRKWRHFFGKIKQDFNEPFHRPLEQLGFPEHKMTKKTLNRADLMAPPVRYLNANKWRHEMPE